jgi:hypothetical protein
MGPTHFSQRLPTRISLFLLFLQEIISVDGFLSAEILEERAKEQRNNSCSASYLAPKGSEPCKRPKALREVYDIENSSRGSPVLLQ